MASTVAALFASTGCPTPVLKSSPDASPGFEGYSVRGVAQHVLVPSALRHGVHLGVTGREPLVRLAPRPCASCWPGSAARAEGRSKCVRVWDFRRGSDLHTRGGFHPAKSPELLYKASRMAGCLDTTAQKSGPPTGGPLLRFSSGCVCGAVQLAVSHSRFSSDPGPLALRSSPVWSSPLRA